MKIFYQSKAVIIFQNILRGLTNNEAKMEKKKQRLNHVFIYMLSKNVYMREATLKYFWLYVKLLRSFNTSASASTNNDNIG